MELTAKVVPAAADANADTSVDVDSSDDSGTIIAYDPEAESGSVDEDGNPVEGSSGSSTNGDSDDGDAWYHPLSFDQMCALAIGGGILVIGGVLASVIFCRRKSTVHNISVRPEDDKNLSADHIVEPEFFASSKKLGPMSYNEVDPLSSDSRGNSAS